MGELSIGTELTEALVDSTQSVVDRVAIAERLSYDDSPATLRALIRVAQTQDLPDALATAVSASLGRICFRRTQDVDELEMADFSGPAYLGYDMEIGRLLRLASDVKCAAQSSGCHPVRGQGGERQVEKHDIVLVTGNGGILDHHSTLVLSPNAAR